MIKLLDISKTFVQWSERIVLYRDLSLQVEQGEFVMITGQSGSWKTTLFNIISWLETVDTGDVIVNEQRISAMSDAERTKRRAKTIGFVFQKFHLVPQLTVRENLELPGDLAPLRKRFEVDHILKKVGISSKADVYPDVLSGGEQQRVAIARAFMYQTPLLLADEPTWNLDLWNSENVMTLLKDLQKSTWVTIVMITHEQELLSRADRVVRMEEIVGGKTSLG